MYSFGASTFNIEQAPFIAENDSHEIFQTYLLQHDIEIRSTNHPKILSQ